MRCWKTTLSPPAARRWANSRAHARRIPASEGAACAETAAHAIFRRRRPRPFCHSVATDPDFAWGMRGRPLRPVWRWLACSRQVRGSGCGGRQKRLPAGSTGATVRTVLDGRTLLLADGRQARLAGIEIANAGNAGARGAGAPHRRPRRPAARLGPKTDRYGRIAGLISVSGAAPLQVTLLAQGQARVAAAVGDKACAAAFGPRNTPPGAPGLAFGDATI